jgi:hypothetical protein
MMSEEREVEGEDKVVFKAIGALVIFAGVEEVEACVALFEGTSGTCEEGTPVLDVDGRGVKIVVPLLVDR